MEPDPHRNTSRSNLLLSGDLQGFCLRFCSLLNWEILNYRNTTGGTIQGRGLIKKQEISCPQNMMLPYPPYGMDWRVGTASSHRLYGTGLEYFWVLVRWTILTYNEYAFTFEILFAAGEVADPLENRSCIINIKRRNYEPDLNATQWTITHRNATANTQLHCKCLSRSTIWASCLVVWIYKGSLQNEEYINVIFERMDWELTDDQRKTSQAIKWNTYKDYAKFFF